MGMKIISMGVGIPKNIWFTNSHLLLDLSYYSCRPIYLECAGNGGLWLASVLISLYCISLVFSGTAICIADMKTFNCQVQNVLHNIISIHIIWFELF